MQEQNADDFSWFWCGGWKRQVRSQRDKTVMEVSIRNRRNLGPHDLDM
jgi:hypothetical protein